MAQTISNPAVRTIHEGLWAVASRSEPGTDRLVKRNDDGTMTCDCPHHFYNAERIATGKCRTCDHVTVVTRLLNVQSSRNEVCRTRPKAAPPVELGLWLITGGAQGSR